MSQSSNYLSIELLFWEYVYLRKDYLCPIVLKYLLSILFFLTVFSQVRAQQDTSRKKPKTELRNAVLFGFSYSRQTPIGELAKRFGGNSGLGFTVGYKLGRNLMLQGGVQAIFSGRVKENNVFDSMTGSTGYLIDVNGSYTDVHIYERGYNWHVDFGKIFPVNKFEKNSGLLITGGLGFMQHKLKFIYSRTLVPQLDNGYYKGYDRLTNGLMLRGFIGYQRIDPKGMLSFMGGIEILDGFTKNRREFNYDTRVKDDHLRNDLLIGARVGIMIALQGRKAGTKKGDEERYFE